jgi:hypothetical protein
MTPTPPTAPVVSRRQFAARAALATAVVVLPAELGSGRPVDDGVLGGAAAPAAQDEPYVAALTPAARARFEAMWQAVERKHGSRLTDAQKTLMRRIVASDAKMLDAVYALPLDNGDAPATTLALVAGAAAPGR